MAIKITWLGHASIMVRSGSKTIYVDPWKVKGDQPKADIILLTHDHYDHYSEDDISALSSDTTVIVGPKGVPLAKNVIGPGGSIMVKDINIEAIPAYNIDKEFHPKENNWVGYIFTLDNKRIYHAGDTDRIPEMKDLNVDIAIIPVGGVYTMDALSAIDAINDIRPRHVIPIHFGDIVGSREDAEKLLKVTTCNIHILDPGETLDLD
ncbi:MAG: MBL fold metallo-hydrolase [Deltaproteobacteria bacterium]|nr:MBL fold metallo-hydrolase [Deltaproteobacteria bacterium]